MRAIVGSHLDDAVLGAGSYLSESQEPVITVFTGAPRDPLLCTPYDMGCGFSSSVDAMQQRRIENQTALTILGSGHVGLEMLDHQYATNRPHVNAIAETIARAIRDLGCDGIVGPLGIQHPDHLLVSEACLWLANQGVPTWLYEDLPYRVVWPEQAMRRHYDLRDHGWHLVPDFLGGGDSTLKAQALNCYASQEVDIHCCLVPERFWAVAS